MASTTPFLSQVQIFAFNFAPQGWAKCNGQFLPINQNQALFSLLGTTYGGNGQTTFGLPNLQGRVAMHKNNGFILGQTGGEVSHTLSLNEMPAHTHSVLASGNAPNKTTPLNNYFASNTGFGPYGNTPASLMNAACVLNTGGSQPHNNTSPYLVLNFCIALQGVFPSPN